MVIVPNGSDYTKWVKTFLGTGPFKMTSYQTGQGATFAPNPNWWGGKVLPAKLQHIFYDKQQPQILALSGGDVDIVNLIVPQGAEAVLNSPDYKLWVTKSSQHRELSMRNDQKPWNDKNVRGAMALSLNRPEIAQALFKGYAQLGNDNPFAPIFRSTDTERATAGAGHRQGQAAAVRRRLPQRVHDRPVRRDLPGDPRLAQIIKEAAAAINITINLHIEDQSPLLRRRVYGKSDWLDGAMSLVDYGHRGVPNVFLNAPLKSDGTWNAAHFKNPQYDKLVNQYVAALDLSTQRKLAGQIQTLLLDETPLILPYWFDAISVSKANIGGVVTTGMGQIFLNGAGITT